jgi:fermentation-respiration switch protein FrsA (DUF1100 family)
MLQWAGLIAGPFAFRIPRPMLLRLTRIVLLLALAAYLATLGLLYAYQRDLVFPLNPAKADIASAGLPAAEEVSVTTADGERLVAWAVAPRGDKPVLLYFQGNAGNLGGRGRAERLRALTADGTGLFAISYRGYGGSTGSPSEEGLQQDARAAYAAAAQRYGADRLIGYGESLGTGVVLKLAAERPLKAVVLEAPYLSALAVAEARYPYLPLGPFMRDPFRSDTVIEEINAPLLVMHGERDGVIPIAQGQALYDLAKPPKRFLRFPEGRHADLPDHGAIPEVRRFLADVAQGQFSGAQVRTVP